MPADKRDEAYRGVIDQLVAYHLIAQEARSRKLAATEADVDARLTQIKQSFPNEDAFKQGIAAQGLTVENLRTQTRSSLEVSKFIDNEVNAKIVVADAEVGTFYQQNLDRFKQGETVHASHILIGVPQNAPPAQKAEAKTRAQAALNKVIEKRAPRTASLEEVGGQIKQFLEQGQREKKLDDFVTQAKSKSKIEILV